VSKLEKSNCGEKGGGIEKKLVVERIKTAIKDKRTFPEPLRRRQGTGRRVNRSPHEGLEKLTGVEVKGIFKDSSYMGKQSNQTWFGTG